MKQYLEIKIETDKGPYSNKIEIANERLKYIDSVFEAINKFKPYTTEDGWTHNHNFPLNPNKNQNEKSIYELYEDSINEINNLVELLLQSFKLQDYEYIHSITDIDIIYENEIR